jgi:hypothetical protein
MKHIRHSFVAEPRHHRHSLLAGEIGILKGRHQVGILIAAQTAMETEHNYTVCDTATGSFSAGGQGRQLARICP